MVKVREWIISHPDIWEFIKFNILSNCATITNFIIMYICTNIAFSAYKNVPFSWFIFDYTTKESLMFTGFLSFLVATAFAQVVNFFVQKNLVFKSNADFKLAVPKYIALAVVLVIVSAALPAYTMAFFRNLGADTVLASTLANIINIIVQVAISYPAMKFIIMPKN